MGRPGCDYVEWVRANLPRPHRVAHRLLGDRADDDSGGVWAVALLYHQPGSILPRIPSRKEVDPGRVAA